MRIEKASLGSENAKHFCGSYCGNSPSFFAVFWAEKRGIFRIKEEEREGILGGFSGGFLVFFGVILGCFLKYF